METSPTVPAVIPVNPEDVARPKYAEVLERRVESLNEPDKTVLVRRIMTANPPTLQALGDELGVTRERIRQIEGRALKKVGEKPTVPAGKPRQQLNFEEAARRAAEERDTDVITEAIERLSELPLPVTEAAVLAAGFGPLNSPISLLLYTLAAKAGHYCRPMTAADGRVWLADASHTPENLIQRLTTPVYETGVVDLVETWSAIEDALRPHAGSDAEAADIAADTIETLGLTEINGCHAVLGSQFSVPERLTRILRAHGGPMSSDELIPFFPDRSPATVRNALIGHNFFVRVSRDEFDLAERGAVALPTLLDLVFAEIDRHGSVAISYLQRLAEQYGYSPGSIVFYGDLPNLIEEDGVLRRRTAEDPRAIPEPALDGQCFRILAGPRHGCWSCISVVSYQRIYAGPERIPSPLAEFLGMEPGCRRQSVTVDATSKIHASWGSYSYLFGSDLRPLFKEKGLTDGDRVRIVVVGPMAIEIEVLPPVPQDPTPFEIIAAGAGLYDAAGQLVSDGDVIVSLAEALDIDPATPVPVLGMRLAKRRNADLYAALELLFPGELDS